MKNICIIIKKQLRDTLKNKPVLIQFIMFPVLTIIMTYSVKIQDMPYNYFVNLFSCMYIGMAPLTCMASIIAEEKEKNTLRVLIMSSVKPIQYLIGVGGYIGGMCFIGTFIFCITGRYSGYQAVCFMLIMMAGTLCSITIGAAIGIISKNQMAETSITVPVMMIFSFLPMLSLFNDTIKSIARFTYTQQINLIITSFDSFHITAENIIIFIVNLVVAYIVFLCAYKRSRLL